MLQLLMNLGLDQAIMCYLELLKDLICASSACPCDVDPANGWNPTDIILLELILKNKNIRKQ